MLQDSCDKLIKDVDSLQANLEAKYKGIRNDLQLEIIEFQLNSLIVAKSRKKRLIN